ncbi:nucleotidyltransferase domain-containing protein [Desulfonatronovibrio magnus]|uniref:nucleotidyltransferase domain-containing protein n=1 Tax=Desulfonatronovibrio magnus TaxID=698827 RepID=UPI0005EBA5B1|nr:nucleotidyltransferase domain-containing protein [Desulfonatronovibrio magnus]
MDKREAPEQILGYINQLKMSYSDLKKVYIFGSFVKGSSRKDSDIDMALVFDDVEDTFDRQVQLMKIRRNYDSRIEPHVFRLADFNENHPLAAEIISTGIEIH